MKKKLTCYLFICLLSVMSAVVQSCCPKEKMCKTITSFNLMGMDNSGAEAVEIKNGEVLAAAFMLRLEAEVLAEYCVAPYSFINTTYAFTCRSLDELDEIKSFSLYSSAEFDLAHPAGSSLEDVFVPNDSSGWYGEPKGNYFLVKEPADTGTHIFHVDIILASGKTFQLQTAPVKLVK